MSVALAVTSALFVLFFVTGAVAAPTTFTVTNTNDSGAGSLRQAIIDANSNGNSAEVDTIAFNIPGSEVHTITVASALPNITEPVTINGYSQPGASVNTATAPSPLNNTIKIELSFNNVVGGNGLEVRASGSTIRGLAIYSNTATSSMVAFFSSDGVFRGNYTGLRADGVTRVDAEGLNPGEGGAVGVAFKNAASGCQLGGTSPADRNVLAMISNTYGVGSTTVEASNCTIQGNYIGIAKDGVTDVGGDTAAVKTQVGSGGLNIGGSNNVVGGSVSAARNVISGGEVYQLVISGGNNTVQGNYFGTDYTGKAQETIVNGTGIIISGASNNLIGGTAANQRNTIAGVSGMGIGASTVIIPAYGVNIAPAKNAFLGNSIHTLRQFSYEGFGITNLGIDLYEQTDAKDVPTFEFELTKQGPTPNDDSDSDSGANGQINSPVLKTAQQVNNQITITYNLDVADSPTDQYRVEFYANNESTVFGSGPGQTYLGAHENVASGNDRSVTLTVPQNYANKSLSATTTAVDASTSYGFGGTSEFSQNISIGSISDFDADGSSDAIENAAPNNGDGNFDGIPDRLQPTVTSFLAADNQSYMTLETTGCSENGTVASFDSTSISFKDNGFVYPYGMVDFSLNCSRGDTVNITLYTYGPTDPGRYQVRKYNASTQEYVALPNSELNTVQLGGQNVLKLTYSVQDGGELDDDGEANGVIVDPVGLATAGSSAGQPGELANTGVLAAIAVFIGSSIVALAVFTYLDYRKFKRPLTEAEPDMARQNYTYLHHLKVVTIPVFRYRLRVMVSVRKAEPASSSSDK